MIPSLKFDLLERHRGIISSLENTLDHNFKGIVSGGTIHFNVLNYHRSNRGITSLNLMEERIAFIPVSFHFPTGHFLVEEYNEIIRRLRDAGITDFWYNFVIRKYEKVEPFGPEILTLDHIGVGFVACFFPLASSVVAFFGELLTDFIARRVFVACMKEVASLFLLIK